MLDYYIINEIKKRHQENQREERPFLELPLPPPPSRSPPQEIEEAKRVIIIDTVDIDPEDEFTIDL